MRVAVTGATGFVGRHLVGELQRRGHHVRALVRNPRKARFLAVQGVDVVPGDLADRAALGTLLQHADAVVHLVGIIVQSGAATFTAVHVEGTRRILEAASARGVRRFVHMSAVGPRPDPGATLYHRTKWQAEELVHASGLSAAILRPAVINGPESVPIGTLARMHRWSPVVPVFGHARFPMQPVWIDDVTLAFALAVERRELTGVLELGGPDVITFEEFVRAIGRVDGHPRPLIHVPLGVVGLVARAGDWLGRAAPITTDQLRMLLEGSVTPRNAVESAFGIKPLGFEDGLRRFLGQGRAGR